MRLAPFTITAAATARTAARHRKSKNYAEKSDLSGIEGRARDGYTASSAAPP